MPHLVSTESLQCQKGKANNKLHAGQNVGRAWQRELRDILSDNEPDNASEPSEGVSVGSAKKSDDTNRENLDSIGRF